MFGQNARTAEDRGDGMSLRVNSMFHTIQGEGPFAGRPATFIRLQGCNLACLFCDTEFQEGNTQLTQDLLATAAELTPQSTTLYVITGGEPLLQNVGPLVKHLASLPLFVDVQIETAGLVWPEGFDELAELSNVHIVVSPKTPCIHPKVAKYAKSWKYIIDHNDDVSHLDGLPTRSTQKAGARSGIARGAVLTEQVFLQPMERYRLVGKKMKRDAAATWRNVVLCRELALKHGYRISLQQHKILRLP